MGIKNFQPKNQQEEVLLYLKKHGSITALEAMQKLFVIDLAGVIRDLKKKINIESVWVYKKNIYGRPIQYKRYYIEPEYRLNLFERLRLYM
mgnify:CR=1 FL=1